MTQVDTATSSGGAGTTKNLTFPPYLMGDTSGTGIGTNFVTYDTTTGCAGLTRRNSRSSPQCIE